MKLQRERREEVEEGKRSRHNFSEAQHQVLRSRKRNIREVGLFFEETRFPKFFATSENQKKKKKKAFDSG